jgi:hypothetical protein
VHPRVEDHALLNGWGQHSSARWEREAEQHAVAALREIGLIGAEDALPVAPAPQPPVDDDVRARAGAWAREQIAAAPEPAEAGPWVRQLAGALEGLKAVGALDRAAFRDLGQTLDRVPIQYGESVDPEDAIDASDGPIAVLRGPSVRRIGWRVMSVELHPALVLVHYDFARIGRAADGSWPLLPDEVDGPAAGAAWIDAEAVDVALSDDVGTPYGRIGRDGIGGGGLAAGDGTVDFEGFATFAPGATAGATVLRVMVGELPIEVAVTR